LPPSRWQYCSALADCSRNELALERNHRGRYTSHSTSSESINFLAQSNTASVRALAMWCVASSRSICIVSRDVATSSIFWSLISLRTSTCVHPCVH
jgi:hypothetical protein